MARREKTPSADLRNGEGETATPNDRSLKKTKLIALMRRPFGASLSELRDETGWQANSIRAMLTNLRNDGQPIYKLKIEEVTRYRLA